MEKVKDKNVCSVCGNNLVKGGDGEPYCERCVIKKLEKMEVENDLKIEKLEALLDILKDEQDIIIGTLADIKATGGDE